MIIEYTQQYEDLIDQINSHSNPSASYMIVHPKPLSPECYQNALTLLNQIYVACKPLPQIKFDKFSKRIIFIWTNVKYNMSMTVSISSRMTSYLLCSTDVFSFSCDNLNIYKFPLEILDYYKLNNLDKLTLDRHLVEVWSNDPYRLYSVEGIN
jgi:hypothetical protein